MSQLAENLKKHPVTYYFVDHVHGTKISPTEGGWLIGFFVCDGDLEGLILTPNGEFVTANPGCIKLKNIVKKK